MMVCCIQEVFGEYNVQFVGVGGVYEGRVARYMLCGVLRYDKCPPVS